MKRRCSIWNPGRARGLHFGSFDRPILPNRDKTARHEKSHVLGIKLTLCGSGGGLLATGAWVASDGLDTEHVPFIGMPNADL